MKELVITVSKVRSRSGWFEFKINSNLGSINLAVRLSVNGKLPAIEDAEYELIKGQMTALLSNVFSNAKHHLQKTELVSYEISFSNMCSGTGYVPLEGIRIETINELVLPVSPDEAIFVFDCIPYAC